MNTVLFSKGNCLSCHQCEMACATQHSLSGNIYSAISEPVTPQSRIFVEADESDVVSFPNKCRHCNPAPCINSCPSGALKRLSDSQTVIIDENKCISCRNCLINCPFGVIIFRKSNKCTNSRLVSIKCDECIDRTKNSLVPACVEACKSGALQYGEIDELIKEKRKKAVKSLLAFDEQIGIVPDQYALFLDLKNRSHAVGK